MDGCQRRRANDWVGTVERFWVARFFLRKKTGEALFGREFWLILMSLGFSSVTSSDFRLPFELRQSAVWGLQICDQVSCFLDKPKALKMGILRGAGWPTAGIEVDYCNHADSSNIKDRPTIKMGTMNWTWGYFFDGVNGVQNFTCYC